jgi:hypothetical protein
MEFFGSTGIEPSEIEGEIEKAIREVRAAKRTP